MKVVTFKKIILTTVIVEVRLFLQASELKKV